MPASKKYFIATLIAIIFHLVGLAGIIFSETFRNSSASFYHLLLMFILICFTMNRINTGFLVFSFLIIVSGFMLEWYGVNTGQIFGEYSYGEGLGPKLVDIPLIIGFNWLIIIYCCGVTINYIFEKLKNPEKAEQKNFDLFRKLAIVLDGACLALLLDWIMEPVAVRLDFWSWGGDGSIPVYNYICWFVVSMLMLLLFQVFRFDKQNKFAVNLLLIQAMFFLLLRTFL